MKDLKKLKDKLILVCERQEAENSKNLAKVEELRRRIDMLKGIADKAETAEEYVKATHDITSAEAEIEFYKRKEAKARPILPEKDYNDYCEILKDKAGELLETCTSEAQGLLSELIDVIDGYNKDIAEVNELAAILTKLTDKPVTYYDRFETIKNGNGVFSIDSFCKYYIRELERRDIAEKHHISI